jgi:hypothetical protein
MSDDKLMAAIDEVVAQKTLTLEGLAAVQTMRDRLKSYEQKEAQSKVDSAAAAARAVEQERDRYRGEYQTIAKRITEVEGREAKLAIAEERVKVKEEMLGKVFDFASLVFKNRSVRENAFVPVPISGGPNMMGSVGSGSETRERVEE